MSKEVFGFRLTPEFEAEFDLGDCIGKGGMAVVYEGEHRATGRSVAVKFLAPNLVGIEEVMTRFGNEAEALSGLSHPNLIEVVSSGKNGEIPYIAFERIDGRDLASVLVELGRIDLYEAVEICQQVIAGLEVAHQAGIVHRDIKPANILLDRSGRVYLADFGIARMSDASITGTGAALGSPVYTAPEQHADPRVDGRSDLYSLGIVLYEMVAGKPPFVGRSLLQTAILHQSTPVPRISATNARFPALLDDLFQRVLAKEPEDRPQTATELNQALVEVVETLRKIGYVDIPVEEEPEPPSPPVTGLASSPTSEAPAPSPGRQQSSHREVPWVGVVVALTALIAAGGALFMRGQSPPPLPAEAVAVLTGLAAPEVERSVVIQLLERDFPAAVPAADEALRLHALAELARVMGSLREDEAEDRALVRARAALADGAAVARLFTHPPDLGRDLTALTAGAARAAPMAKESVDVACERMWKHYGELREDPGHQELVMEAAAALGGSANLLGLHRLVGRTGKYDSEKEAGSAQAALERLASSGHQDAGRARALLKEVVLPSQ